MCSFSDKPPHPLLLLFVSVSSFSLARSFACPEASTSIFDLTRSAKHTHPRTPSSVLLVLTWWRWMVLIYAHKYLLIGSTSSAEQTQRHRQYLGSITVSPTSEPLPPSHNLHAGIGEEASFPLDWFVLSLSGCYLLTLQFATTLHLVVLWVCVGVMKTYLPIPASTPLPTPPAFLMCPIAILGYLPSIAGVGVRGAYLNYQH